MRNFMQKCYQDSLFSALSEHFISLDIVFSVQNTSNIFHCPHVVISGKDMIKLSKRPSSSKNFLVVSDTFHWNFKPILSDTLDVLSNRFSAENSLRNFSLILWFKTNVRSRHNWIQIWTYLWRFKKLKASNFLLFTKRINELVGNLEFHHWLQEAIFSSLWHSFGWRCWNHSPIFWNKY